MKVVIIGGVAGGASAAARIRRMDETAEIVMYERGEYISYANCGLPYYIGGVITERDDLTLQTPEGFSKRFALTVKTRHEVMRLEPEAKRVLVKNLQNGDEYYDNYDKMVVSPGAKPIVPQIKGLDDPRIFTLRNIPDTDRINEFVQLKQPKTAVVVGGGFVGLEIAENLMRKGVQVTVVEAGAHILAMLDADTAAEAQNIARQNGLNLILNNAVTQVTASYNLQFTLKNETISADMAVIAVGVRPDTEFLDGSNVARTPRGAIVVSDLMETSVKDVYAVGDAVETYDFITGGKVFVPLAGPANRQGRIAANNICGVPDSYRHTQGTAVLKLFSATVAATGLNETQIAAAGIRYDKVYLWSASHATYYPGASNMSLKLLFEIPNGKILGAQIVGAEGVDKRIDVIATALRAELTAFELTDLELAYAPPFSSAKDPVNMAGFVAENVLSGKVKQWYPDQVAAIDKRTDVLRLDVRTKGEVSRGLIPGTEIFIPLDELRDRLNELDAQKEIYVNCQSGLRSYLACRILTQNGFRAYNLSGGYRLWAAIEKNERATEFSHPCGIPV